VYKEEMTNYQLVSATCFCHLRQIRRVRKSLDAGSTATLVHAFVTSRIDYCNVVLAESPRATTDKSWMLPPASSATHRSMTAD